MIGSVGAMLIGGAVGGIAQMSAANKAAKAAQAGADAQYALGQDQLAEQRRQFDAQQALFGDVRNEQNQRFDTSLNRQLLEFGRGADRQTNIARDAYGDVSQMLRNSFQDQRDIAANTFNAQAQTLRDAQGNFRPAITAGNNALAILAYENGAGARPQGYQGYEGSEGYKFQVGQAMDAVNAANAAGAGLGSGRALQAAQRAAQGLAQTDYGNYYNRLSGLSAQGQNAAANYGNLASQISGARGVMGQAIGGARDALGTNLTNARSGLGATLGNIVGNRATSRANAFGNWAGQTAGTAGQYGANMAGAGQNFLANQSGAYGAMGNAIGNRVNGQMAGAIGQGNALAGMAGNLAGIYQFNQLLQNKAGLSPNLFSAADW